MGPLRTASLPHLRYLLVQNHSKGVMQVWKNWDQRRVRKLKVKVKGQIKIMAAIVSAKDSFPKCLSAACLFRISPRISIYFSSMCLLQVSLPAVPECQVWLQKRECHLACVQLQANHWYLTLPLAPNKLSPPTHSDVRFMSNWELFSLAPDTSSAWFRVGVHLERQSLLFIPTILESWGEFRKVDWGKHFTQEEQRREGAKQAS